MPNDDRAVLDAIEARIVELANVDQGGELFRCAHDQEDMIWLLPPQLPGLVE